jgi:ankyrin repeat protein
MTKTQKFYVAILVVAAAVGVGTYAYIHARLKLWDVHRTFAVDYVYDRGIKSLRITRAETGQEETDRKWRAKVAAVAESYVPKVLSFQGLTRAVGRFYADTWGPDVLPLYSYGNQTSFARDPDVTPLMCALERGDGAKARELIAGGANVKASDQHGWTALMRAVMHTDEATVRLLLATGAEVNARSKDGETALLLASELNRVPVVRELIRHGADVNLSSEQQITALMAAASRSPCAAKLLLAAGADVNLRDVVGKTALMIAAGNGRGDLVRLLVQAGADVNAKDNDGGTALSRALYGHHTEVAKYLRAAGARH